MSKRIRWTYDLVKEFVESKGYQLVSKEYRRAKDPIVLICPKGHEFQITFYAFKNNPSCKICDGREYNYKYVKDTLLKHGYELLSDKYINSHVNITMKHIECGHIFDMHFANFNFGQRCPKCSGVEKLTYEEVKEFIESEGYKLLSTEYKNNSSHLDIQCPKGHNYKASFANFKRGYRCPMCKGEKLGDLHRFDYKYVKEYIESFGYKLITDIYVNCDTDLDMICPKGHAFKMKFYNFKKGNRCPVCRESKGERRVGDFLRKNNIKYERQYTFKNCKFKNVLPFDFYLPDYNICIEFDGRQHYEIIDYFGGLDGFIDTKIRDTIKTYYCEYNNIKLIRIPHWDIENIEYILNKQLIN